MKIHKMSTAAIHAKLASLAHPQEYEDAKMKSGKVIPGKQDNSYYADALRSELTKRK